MLNAALTAEMCHC